MSDDTTPTKPDAEKVVPPVPAPISGPTPEIGGRKGPDPVRYGDWEKGGIAVDF